MTPSGTITAKHPSDSASPHLDPRWPQVWHAQAPRLGQFRCNTVCNGASDKICASCWKVPSIIWCEVLDTESNFIGWWVHHSVQSERPIALKTAAHNTQLDSQNQKHNISGPQAASRWYVETNSETFNRNTKQMKGEMKPKLIKWILNGLQ